MSPLKHDCRTIIPVYNEHSEVIESTHDYTSTSVLVVTLCLANIATALYWKCRETDPYIFMTFRKNR